VIARPGSVIVVNGVTADLAGGMLRDAQGEPVELRPQAFAVLAHLAANPGRVVGKAELTDAVWQGLAVTDDSLVQCIHEVRRALHDEARTVIRTVPRRGYLFQPPLGSMNAEPRPKARLRTGSTALAALALLALVAFAMPWRLAGPAAPPPDRIGVAVMPFVAGGADPRQAEFARAFTADITTELARVQLLKVPAGATVAQIAGPPVDFRTLGDRLGADYLVDGRVDLQPTAVRVTASLIDATSGTLVWTDRFERPAGDRPALRDPLVAKVVATLSQSGGVIWRDWLARAQRERPDDLTSLELLIRAKQPYARMDAPGIRGARAFLEEAVARDPGFLRAQVLLAETHLDEVFAEWGDPAAAWVAFETTVAAAASVDPDAGSVLCLRALVAFRNGQPEAGRALWDRALERYPNDVVVLGEIGEFATIALGAEATDFALGLLDRLEDLDHLHKADLSMRRPYPLFFAGRPAEAADIIRRLVRPWFAARLLLALALAEAGDTAAATTEAAEILRRDPDFSAEDWLARGFYQPGGSSALRISAAARKAGLPICAADPSSIPPDRRLAECATARAG
jgi:TolB-like protein/DNA-binding winged helix-turn-helix (wHTH) protein